MVHELARWRGASNEIALYLVTALLLQEREMRLGFYPLRNDPKSQRMAHGDDGRGYGCVIRLDGDLPNKRSCDLEGIEREMLEVAEGRVAGAEVIHCQVEAHGAEGMQRLGAFPMVIPQHAFGELQTQIPRLKT